jgi:hypothetical protein
VSSGVSKVEKSVVWLTDTDIDLSGLDLIGNLFKPKDSTLVSLSSSAAV